MKHIIQRINNYVYMNRKMLWYMFCFIILGLIDQRKQSAPGEIQMLFTNLTPVIIAALLVPSIELSRFQHKVYKRWAAVCFSLLIVAYIWGKTTMPYKQAWIPALISITIWSCLVIYIVKEWKHIEGIKRLHQPFFGCVLALLICMILSKNSDKSSYWYVLIYGGFYLIGIKKEDRNAFFMGLLNGIIIWFFFQQIVAFGFRPYDHIRYKGMYASETFNSLFYLIAYSAFFIKWFLSAIQKKCVYVRFLWFFLSTSCVSFILLTGGRSALVGVLLLTVIFYGWYDLWKNNSFYKLLHHALVWCACVVISFPLVYGCVRYFPTILHHPIWYEGEFVDGINERSVCSFDEWDSEKYISFEEATENILKRVLEIFHMTGFDKNGKAHVENPFVVSVYAAEKVLDEHKSEEILNLVGADKDTRGINVRKIIYVSCLAQLNWHGHASGEILCANNLVYAHAHNMFLDIAYRHGVLAGILYLGIYMYCILQTLWKHKIENIILTAFMIALFGFGMFEQLTMMGQFGVALIWMFFYFAGEDSTILKRKENGECGND